MQASSIQPMQGAVMPAVPLSLRTLLQPADRPRCSACRLREGCLAVNTDDCARRGWAGLIIGGRRVHKGETLFREGQPFNFLYAVRFGTFKAGFTLDDGREQVTGFYFAGDVLGFEGAASGRQATVAVALEESEVCTIPYEEFMRLPSPGEGGMAPAHRLARFAAAELVRDQAAKAITSLRQAHSRVAAFLLMLSRRMRDRGLSSTEFELRMSRAEIGSYLGLTLESVSRSFSYLAEQGWISVHKRSVQVNSIPALGRLCQPAGLVVQDRQVERVTDRHALSA